jgi:hypothetical protein
LPYGAGDLPRRLVDDGKPAIADEPSLGHVRSVQLVTRRANRGADQ